MPTPKAWMERCVIPLTMGISSSGIFQHDCTSLILTLLVLSLRLGWGMLELGLLQGNGSSRVLGLLDARPGGCVFFTLAQPQCHREGLLVGGSLLIGQAVLVLDLRPSHTHTHHINLHSSSGHLTQTSTTVSRFSQLTLHQAVISF